MTLQAKAQLLHLSPRSHQQLCRKLQKEMMQRRKKQTQQQQTKLMKQRKTVVVDFEVKMNAAMLQ